MASNRDPKPSQAEPPPPSPSPSPSPSSSSDDWKGRVFLPALLAGIAGGGYGLVSKHRKVHGLANISAAYAANFAIVMGCYCGTREFVRVTRKSEPDDLLNSAIGGFASGAILGRLQGGQAGAIKYSFMFAVAGTAMDFAILKLRPILESSDSLKLPEWSPIQILDEEQLAAKKAREQKLYSQTTLGKLNKEDS
ncbi:hypothetical protein EUGRSUZ_K02137 [Eucalyptus grandis]|uniref:Mitochondrial import inner membrane translocase subunit TIM22 n=2 Tax=Eucalyptus grandis TaxID=71139 RepID=A0A059A541_EUCGR|nr:hypothetical protein EUGRSUZ_K02137 [Eucalyptus grandis]